MESISNCDKCGGHFRLTKYNNKYLCKACLVFEKDKRRTNPDKKKIDDFNKIIRKCRTE